MKPARKIQRKSWSNMPAKLLTSIGCLYNVILLAIESSNKDVALLDDKPDSLFSDRIIPNQILFLVNSTGKITKLYLSLILLILQFRKMLFFK